MTSSGVLRINLESLRSNWLQIKKQISSSANAGAVIKADGYGLGARKIGATLHAAGCRYFFFAIAEEALALKPLLPDSKLIVLGGVRPGDELRFIANRLIPVLHSIESVVRWENTCRNEFVAAPCFIKVDTGMARLGLDITELGYLFNQYSGCPFFSPAYVMSHLANADDHQNINNLQQLNQFHEVFLQFKARFAQIGGSLANSSGVFLGDSWHFDLVRPGAALYGINPTPNLPNPMNPVVSLRLPVLQAKTISQSTSVGYGGSHKAKIGDRLAVVAGGYADGLNRTLGAKPIGLLNGTRVEAVGRMSMDTTVFDISSCQADNLVGSYIDVINCDIHLDYLMQKNASLGYEVLTSLGRRFEREYIDGND